MLGIECVVAAAIELDHRPHGTARAPSAQCTGVAALAKAPSELLGVDLLYDPGPRCLYRASDALMAHREAIEHHLFDRAMDLFDLHRTVTLYDLTNTYFEGEARRQPKARRGHSKEKRTDCPLLTLGLVLDASALRASLASLRRQQCANITRWPRARCAQRPARCPGR